MLILSYVCVDGSNNRVGLFKECNNWKVDSKVGGKDRSKVYKTEEEARQMYDTIYQIISGNIHIEDKIRE